MMQCLSTSNRMGTSSLEPFLQGSGAPITGPQVRRAGPPRAETSCQLPVALHESNHTFIEA